MIDGKIAVHIYAPALSLSGYGTAARQLTDYCLSDDRFMVFLENVPWGNCAFIHESTLSDKTKLKTYYDAMMRYEQAKQQDLAFDISLYCTIPNEFKRRAQICIGVTAGIEVDRVTREWIAGCNQMDLIVVPSEFSANILSQTSYTVKNPNGSESIERISKQISIIPHWFDKPTTIKPLTLDFPTKKNLLFVGMWGNKGGFGEDRKNVADLVRLFYETFKEESDVGLILKTEIILDSEEDLFHCKKKLQDIKSNFKNPKCKVYLLHDLLSEEEMWGLYTHPKVAGLVSLTHGEGYGLPLLEALAAELPALATNWSGHLDFCKKGKGFIPIDFEMKEIPECQVWQGLIDKGAMWASVDAEDTKSKLRKFINSSFPIRKQAKDSLQELTANFSKASIVKKWSEFFNSFIRAKDSSDSTDQVSPQVQQKISEIQKIKTQFGIVDGGEKEKVLYVMPMSFGDIVISTCIVDSLIKSRHFEDEVYFATKKEYFEVLQGLVDTYGVKLIEYADILINSEITREIWDTVYVPGINVQYNFSNWTLGNGNYSLNLLQEFAKQCNLIPPDLTDYCLAPKEYPIPDGNYICLTAVSSKEAKKYKHWTDVVANLKEMIPSVKIVQLGLKNEDLIDGCLDFRGISFNETLFVIQKSIMHIGPDTGMNHAAAALGVPHFVLFASTSPRQCAPHLLDPSVLQICLEPSEVKCGKCHCYKDACQNKVEGVNCISSIEPTVVCKEIYRLLGAIKELEGDEKLKKHLKESRGLPMLSQEIFDEQVAVIKAKREKNGQEQTSQIAE